MPSAAPALWLCLIASLAPADAAAEAPLPSQYPIGSCLDVPPRTKERRDVKGYQFVGVIDHDSTSRLEIDADTKEFIGKPDQSGIRWYVSRTGKKKTRTGRAAFKMRILRFDPRGVVANMMLQDKLKAYEGVDEDGERIISVAIPKPEPFWRRLPFF